MARVHRVVLALLLLVCSFGAWAVVCTQYSGVVGQWRSTNIEAATDYKNASTLAPGYSWNGEPWCDSATSVYCHNLYNKPTGGTGTENITLSSRTGDYCAENFCLTRLKDKDAGTFHWQGLNSPFFICDPSSNSNQGNNPNCVVKALRDISYQVGDVWESMGPAKYTGDSCNNATATGTGSSVTTFSKGSLPGTAPTGTTAAKDSPTEPCNGWLGEVNGVTTCVKREDVNVVQSSVPKTSTSTNADGTTQTQSITVDRTCSAATGLCTQTTTTSTTTSTGTLVTTQTTSMPISEFCAANPGARECGGDGKGGMAGSGNEASSFGGACAAGGGNFSCEGDAVECAVAQATSKMNCALNTDSPEAQAYSAAKGASAGLGTSSQALSSSSFNTANLLAPGAGLVDKQITINASGISTNLTLPFSNLNSWLAILGDLLVAVSFIIAMMIVGKGVN